MSSTFFRGIFVSVVFSCLYGLWLSFELPSGWALWQNTQFYFNQLLPVAIMIGLALFWFTRGKQRVSQPRYSSRQTHSSAMRQPAPIPMDSSRESGIVKWFNVTKGFGFITRSSGDDIFVHYRSIRGHGRGRRVLQESQTVQFTVTQGDKGLQAEDVSVVA